MLKIKKSLDFYVIGSKKSGTTSLYYYFSKMPELCIHDCKELSFLSDGFAESGSFEHVVDTQYQSADPSLIWGAVTPHYIYDSSIPEKLKEFMPNGKYIVMVRDPIERAISNYHMMKKQGYEDRSFDNVINEQLDQTNLIRQRGRAFYHGADIDSYVVWGEYGRLLETFVNKVGQESLLVVFLEELADDPVNVFSEICNFIGVKSYLLPDNLGVKYYDTEKRDSYVQYWHKKLRKNKILATLWQKFTPSYFKRDLVYKYSLGSNTGLDKPVLTPTIEKYLINHYQSDVKRLEFLAGRTVPWTRFNENLQ